MNRRSFLGLALAAPVVAAVPAAARDPFADQIVAVIETPLTADELATLFPGDSAGTWSASRVSLEAQIAFAQDMSAWQAQMLRSMAAGLGVPFQCLASDLRRSDHAAHRAALDRKVPETLGAGVFR